MKDLWVIPSSLETAGDRARKNAGEEYRAAQLKQGREGLWPEISMQNSLPKSDPLLFSDGKLGGGGA